MDWETSNNAMKTVSRIVWNYFDFLHETQGRDPGVPLDLTPPSGYVPLGAFVPAE